MNNELTATIETLTREFDQIPSGEFARFEDVLGRVEKMLAENPSAPIRVQMGLRLLSVEALDASRQTIDESTLRRLLSHLAALADHAEQIGRPSLISLVRRKKATILARYEVATDDDLTLAVTAFEDVLDHPEADDPPATLGAYAFNAATFRLRLEADVRAAANDRHVDELFRAALTHYKNAGLQRRAADAAAELAQLAVQRLTRVDITAEDAATVFADGWRFINEALANVSITDEPIVWGQQNEVAAELLARRHGVEPSANEVIHYLDLALDAYRRAGDSTRTARCALRLADRVSHLGASWWKDSLIRRFLYYVDLVVAVPLATPAQQGARYVLLANSCARVIALEVAGTAEISQRLRTLAESAINEAPADDEICLQAQLLIGNSWLGTTERVEDALARASAAFERAARHARAARQPDQETKALRLLGIALGRRLIDNGESELYPALVKTLEQAAAQSVGEERALTYLNVVSVMADGIRKGLNVSANDARAAAVRARELRSDLKPAHRDYLDSLASLLDEVAFGIDEAMQSLAILFDADGRLLPGFARPNRLYFKWFSTERHNGETQTSQWKRTMFLLLEDDGRCDGSMDLSYVDDTVTTTLVLACPVCETPWSTTVRLVVSFEDDLQGRARLHEHLRGGRECPVCRSSVEVQHATLARVAGRTDLIFPDVFSSTVRTFVTHQGLVLLAVYQAWTAQLPDDGYSLPWSSIERPRETEASQIHLDDRQRYLLLLLAGLRFEDEGAVERFLRSQSPLLSEEQVSMEEVGAVLPLLGPADGDQPSIAQTTNRVNAMLQFARKSGPAFVLDALHRAWQAREESASAFHAAVAIARDVERRRAFLQRFLEETPDYSADREAELYRLLQGASDLEIKTMEANGVPESDPEEYQRAVTWAQGSRESTREMIERDRQNNSSAPAKALLRERLTRGRGFVLLLRAFRVDVKTGLPSRGLRALEPDVSDPRVTWHTRQLHPSGYSVMEAIASAPAGHTGVIMVANVSDPFPPRTLPKLFVTNVEWRNLAFALIAEAAAIVFVLRAEELSTGVVDEMRAILTLERTAHTVIVLSDADDPDDVFASMIVDATASANPQELTARLTQMGFPRVCTESAFLERPWDLIGGITNVDLV